MMSDGVEVSATVSGHSDPEGVAPWALQLVVSVPKVDPPSHSAVCAAAAVAVVSLLADERSAPGGEWHAAVLRWSQGRIRKHVRRARGAAWGRVAALPGVVATVDGATVVALVPSATDDVPRDVARCQLSGLELVDAPGERVSDAAVVPGGPVVVSLSADPVLSTGKAAAAAGHAAQLAWWDMDVDRRRRWAESGFAVAVELPDAQRWAQRVASSPVRVSDAGFTEVTPGTVTSTATWA